MKKYYTSKTVWFNVLALVVALATAFGYVGELSPDLEVFVPALIALINVVLRFLTNQGLSL